MSHRRIRILSLALGCGVMGALWLAPAALADRSRDRPTAPKDIDDAPALVPIPNARVTKSGLLIGGQPAPEQLKAIHDAGYRTIVTLRTATERGDESEEAAVERMGLTFVSIPVAGAAGLTEENARALDKALGREDALPAVVHCSTGQRVSALLGLRAFVVDRVSAGAAIDLAKRLGMKKFEAALRERIVEICESDASRSCEDVQ